MTLGESPGSGRDTGGSGDLLAPLGCLLAKTNVHNIYLDCSSSSWHLSTHSWCLDRIAINIAKMRLTCTYLLPLDCFSNGNLLYFQGFSIFYKQKFDALMFRASLMHDIGVSLPLSSSSLPRSCPGSWRFCAKGVPNRRGRRNEHLLYIGSSFCTYTHSFRQCYFPTFILHEHDHHGNGNG